MPLRHKEALASSRMQTRLNTHNEKVFDPIEKNMGPKHELKQRTIIHTRATQF